MFAGYGAITMMVRFLFSALAFLSFFVGRANGFEVFRKTPVTPGKSGPFGKQAQLAVRGGALPTVTMVDRDLASKIFTVAYLLQGPVCLFAPRVNAAAYGVKGSDVAEFLMKTSGGSITGLGIMAHCLLQKGTSARAAIGASAVPFLIPLVDAFRSGSHDTIGPRRGTLLAGTLLVALAASTAFDDRPWASGYLRLYVALGGLNSALGAIFPVAMANRWGLRLDDDRVGDKVMMRCLSTWRLGVHLMSFAALSGADHVRALGYGSVPAFALLLAGNFVTGEFRELGMAVGPQLFWFVFNLILLCPMILG